MFKDLAKFHEVGAHPKEDVDSLFKFNAKGEGMLSDEVNPKGKRVHPADSTTQCSCKASKGSTLNPQSFRARTQPRSFSVLEASLSAVMEKLIKSGHLKPLTPTFPPKVLSVGYNANAYCAFHQMPSHLTEACFYLRHEIQDLIDNGSVQVPPKPNVISNSLPKHRSDSLVGQVFITSTQINPSSTIFNLSHYIVPANQPKPIVSIPSELKVHMMAVGRAIEVFTADIWIDSDEKLANEKIDWPRSNDQRSIE
ncbi:hypothetical protein RHMOL_Rhmol02G0182800 [Rhododendron molle]|uniref:Uncharacterized protein n=1 Tax=Rhododendron molle TaxID=49168 RepID=A0ACC0PR90_RHOML|nr:hypothetical protein RHMOL_Rhmol02G0182800 [Rhododendron molle]